MTRPGDAGILIGRPKGFCRVIISSNAAAGKPPDGLEQWLDNYAPELLGGTSLRLSSLIELQNGRDSADEDRQIEKQGPVERVEAVQRNAIDVARAVWAQLP